jgi:hypothetical protein
MIIGVSFCSFCPFKKSSTSYLINWLSFLIKLDNIDYTWTRSCLHGVSVYYGLINFDHSTCDMAYYIYTLYVWYILIIENAT